MIKVRFKTSVNISCFFLLRDYLLQKTNIMEGISNEKNKNFNIDIAMFFLRIFIDKSDTN